jgi:hypothetical protein
MEKFIKAFIKKLRNFFIISKAHLVGIYLLLRIKLKYLQSSSFKKDLNRLINKVVNKLYNIVIRLKNNKIYKSIINFKIKLIYIYKYIIYYFFYFFKIFVVIPKKFLNLKYIINLKNRRMLFRKKKSKLYNSYHYILFIYYYFFGVIYMTFFFIESQIFYNYHRFKNRIKYSKKYKNIIKILKPLLTQIYEILKFLFNNFFKLLKLVTNFIIKFFKFIFKLIFIFPIRLLLKIFFLIIESFKLLLKFLITIFKLIFNNIYIKKILFFFYIKKKYIYLNFIYLLRKFINKLEFSIQKDKYFINYNTKTNKEDKDNKNKEYFKEYVKKKKIESNKILFIFYKLFLYLKDFFKKFIINIFKFIIFFIFLIKERIMKIKKQIIDKFIIILLLKLIKLLRKFLIIIIKYLDNFIKKIFKLLNLIYKILKKLKNFYINIKNFLKKNIFSKIKFDFYYYRDLILLLTIIYPFIIYPIKEIFKLILYRYIINPFIYNISDLKRINKNYENFKENIKQNYNFLKIFIKIWYKSIPLGIKLAISEYNYVFRKTFPFRRKTNKEIEIRINKYIYTIVKNSNKIKHEVLINRKILLINIKILLKTYIQKLLIYLNKLIILRIIKKFFGFLKEKIIKIKNLITILKYKIINLYKNVNNKYFYKNIYYFFINFNPIEILIIYNKLKEFLINSKNNIKSKLKIKIILLNLNYLSYISFKNIYFFIKPFIRWFIIIHISIIFGATIFFTFFYLGDWFRMLVFDIYSCLMAIIHMLIWFSNRITLKYLNINALKKIEKKTIENNNGITQLNMYLGNIEEFLGLYQVSGVKHLLKTQTNQTDWRIGKDSWYRPVYYMIDYDVVIYHDQLLQEKWMQRKLQGLYETAFNTESIFDDYNNYLYFKIFMDYFQSLAFSRYISTVLMRIMVFFSLKTILREKDRFGPVKANANNFLTEKILHKTEKKQHLRRREKKIGKFRLRGIELENFESKSDEVRKESLTYKLTKLLFGEEIILTNRAFMARYWELSLKHKKEMMYKFKTYKDRQTFYNEFLRGDFNSEISKIFREYNEQKEEKMKKLFFLWMKKKQEFNKLKTITNINNERDKYNIIQTQLEQIIEKTNKIFNNSLSLNIIKSEYLQILNKSLYYKIYLRLLNGEKFVNVKNERRLVLPYSKFLSPEPFNLFKFSNNITNIKLEKNYISKLNSKIKNTPLLRHNSKIIYNVNLINKTLMQLKYHYIFYRNTIPIDNALQIILQKELYRFFLRRFLQNIDLKDLKETSFMNYEQLISSFPTSNFFGIRSFPIPNMDSNYSTLQTRDEIINKDVDNFFLEQDVNHDNFSHLLVDMRGWYPIRRIWKSTITEKKILLLNKLEKIIENEKIRKKMIKRRNVHFRLSNKFFSWLYNSRRTKVSRIHYRRMYLRKLGKHHEFYGTLKRFDKSYYGRIRTTVHKTYGASVYFSRSILRKLKFLFGYTPGAKYSDEYLEEARKISLRSIFFREMAKYRIKRDRLNILKDNELSFNLRKHIYLSKANKDLRESMKKYRAFKVKSYFFNKSSNKNLIKQLDEYAKEKENKK